MRAAPSSSATSSGISGERRAVRGWFQSTGRSTAESPAGGRSTLSSETAWRRGDRRHAWATDDASIVAAVEVRTCAFSLAGSDCGRSESRRPSGRTASRAGRGSAEEDRGPLREASRRRKVRVAFVDADRAQSGVEPLCRVLHVARRSYHAAKRQAVAPIRPWTRRWPNQSMGSATGLLHVVGALPRVRAGRAARSRCPSRVRGRRATR